MTTNIATTTTYFMATHYEVTNGVVTKYYYAGSQRIAMRQSGTLSYILGDHLGSTSLITDANGQNPIETRYKAWGEERYTSGTSATKYTFTGQYSYTGDFGLMFYNARWYDPSLGRFNQADSIVPESTQGVQAWDRYAYANNNPVIHTDPSGHNVPICFACTLWNSVSDWWTGKSDGYNGPNGVTHFAHPLRRLAASIAIKDEKADSIWGLMAHAYYHEKSANITGQALEKVQQDSAFIKKQAEFALGIKTDPRYGKEAFSVDAKIYSAQFGEHGSMLTDATYEETWMLRAANITFSNTNVDKQGNISTTISVDDTLDLRPDWGGSTRTGLRGFGYNLATTLLGFPWHDLMGASDEMKVKATWETILPAKRYPWQGR